MINWGNILSIIFSDMSDEPHIPSSPGLLFEKAFSIVSEECQRILISTNIKEIKYKVIIKYI